MVVLKISVVNNNFNLLNFVKKSEICNFADGNILRSCCGENIMRSMEIFKMVAKSIP